MARHKAGTPAPSKSKVKKLAKRTASKAVQRSIKHKMPAAKRSKVSKAHTLRKKARASLRKAGKHIPKDLKKGGLKKAMKKAKKKKKMPAAKRGKVSKAHTLRK